MSRRSLRTRLVATVATALGLVLAAGGFAIYHAVRHSLYAQLDHALGDKLRFLESACFLRNGRISFHVIEASWERMTDPADPEFFQFSFPDGILIHRSASLGGTDLPMLGIDSRVPVTGDVMLPGDRAGRAAGVLFTAEVREGPGPPPVIHLVVAHPREHVIAGLASLRRRLLGVGAALAAALVTSTLLAAQRGLRPLDELGGQIAATTDLSAGTRFAVTRPVDELAPVIDRLNQLMERIESALARERQFASDAAHELRNPLAAVRTDLESALSRERTADEYRAAIASAQETQGRLELVVENLLWLARLEAGAAEPPEGAAVALPPLLRRAWKPVFNLAEARGLEVAWSLPRDLPPVWAAPALVEIVLRNLFENAANYCPESGRVLITAGADPACVRLTVANTDPGLDPQRLESLFERHVRGGPSAVVPGAGIGLALSRKAARTLGGDLEARLEAGLLRFELSLPRGDAGEPEPAKAGPTAA